jgi:hypothetical protein
MSKEQDAVFFRNFALVMVLLTVFGFIAAFLGRHLAPQADRAHGVAAPATAAHGEDRHE